MPPEPTHQAWAQIRYDYEHTDRPVEDICAEHDISSGTLRDRMRRWGWTRRRAPIPREGPPPAPAPQIDPAAPALPTGQEFDTVAPSLAAAPRIETAAPCLVAVPHVAAGGDAGTPGEPDDRAIVPRLQRAVARVLPAIETIVAKLGAEPAHPREIERAARALAALTRILRELNNLLSQRQAAAADDPAAADDSPEDIDAFRLDLARRIDAFVASRTGEDNGGAEAAASETPAIAPSPLAGEGDRSGSTIKNG
jgi:hypothetical protein